MNASERTVLEIRVQPRSSQRGLQRTGCGEYKAWVHSAPDKGKANKEVIELVAEHFGLPLSRVTILSGFGSRNKRVAVETAGRD